MIYGTVKRKRNWRSRRDSHRSKNYRVVEKMFWYYNRTKTAYLEADAERKNYYQSGYKEGGGSSNHAFVSDPTAQLAMKHLKQIRKVVIDADTPSEDVVLNPKAWIFVVERTLKEFENEPLVREVLRRRFLKNEPWTKTRAELDIYTENEYYKLKDIGITFAKDCALQLGLITAFDIKEFEDFEVL